MLESFATHNDEFMAVFDARGAILERYPSTGQPSLPSTLLPGAAADHRRVRPVQSVVTSDGRAYDARWRWIADSRQLDGRRYWLVHAKPRPTTPGGVAERLQNYGLSKRESQVAELVFTGKTNQRIAEQLFISRDTVKTHCKHIFGKLGIARRTEFLRLMSQT
jgi:DNA-binding CsgD family transcriptional regulator